MWSFDLLLNTTDFIGQTETMNRSWKATSVQLEDFHPSEGEVTLPAGGGQTVDPTAENVQMQKMASCRTKNAFWISAWEKINHLSMFTTQYWSFPSSIKNVNWHGSWGSVDAALSGLGLDQHGILEADTETRVLTKCSARKLSFQTSERSRD